MTFAWVIEAPGQHYLATRFVARQYEFHWSQDHLKAIRFFSKEQAEGVMCAVRSENEPLFSFARLLGEAKAIEHIWLPSSPTGETAPPAGACGDEVQALLVPSKTIRTPTND